MFKTTNFNNEISIYFLIILLILNSCKEKNTPSPSPKIIQVFRDDFKDNSKEWRIISSDTINTSITNDSLFISYQGNNTGWEKWLSIKIDTTKNWSIKSTITWKSGQTNFGYGLIWDKKDAKNGNYFNLTSNGFYQIGICKNGEYNYLKNWSYFYVINPFNNTLEIKKEGNTLYFIINNKIAHSTKNIPLLNNGIGFVVFGKMKVAFDYLDVSEW